MRRMRLALLSALLLAAGVGLALPSDARSERAEGVARDSNGRIARSMTERRRFQRANPCPATGKTRGACPGYAVDHVMPLKRRGPDTPANMQWLKVEAWNDKTRWE
jgi:hypothetical protein